MKVFSFCLYGTASHYYTGLLENIRIIQEYYPDFSIHIYLGECDPLWTLPETVTVIRTGKEGAINMLFRYVPLRFADIGFVRDADSRITKRDRWCIDKFLESNYSYHCIRDHVWHKSKIMGGLFGWKEQTLFDFDETNPAGYGYDESVLSDILYPRIRERMMIHTNMYGLVGEHTERIGIPQEDTYDFVGNVYETNVPKFEYSLNIVEQVEHLRSHDQFAIIQYLTDDIDPYTIPFEHRTRFYDACFIANYYLQNIEKCQYWLSCFEFADIIPHVLNNSHYLFGLMNKTIVATFDSERQPTETEIVIVYGSYPDWHLALPQSNKMYRHVSLFKSTEHDIVEYDHVWEPVDIIYILNLEERVDRYYETLLSLASVRAPLHRIHHYIAKRDELPAYAGATKNHVDVVDHFCTSGHEHALVLEDDIMFIDRESVISSLQTFFSKPRDYAICFLSLSKYGRREPHDDIVGRTLQPCTTSSAYFLQKSTAQKVYSTLSEGFQNMLASGDHHNNCVDRYWTRIPDLYYFRKKLGFQRPSYSNLTRCVSDHLD